MSGVAGAERVKSRQDFAQFLKDYEQLISQFPGYVGMKPSGSYNSDLAKQDFGDIDIIVHIKSNKDKATVKKELVNFLQRQPETKIVPFSSEKHAGKRTYNAGELVSVRYHDDELGYSAQIDNIVALDETEASFKLDFLNLPAEKQGLILGLVKIAAIETDPQRLFKSLGIKAPLLKQSNQEYEFNLSSVELQLRLVTYKPGTFEQADRKVIWTSRSFDDLRKLLYQYDLDANFDQLLAQAKATIKNPRSNNRMAGVFGSMVSVKSGEVGTAKGAGKEKALGKVKQAFGESRSRLLNELMKPKDRTVVFAFGRFQPPTTGHELLINAVGQIAKSSNANAVVYVSRTQDHKTNPLSVEQKMYYLKKMFPLTNFVAADDQVRTPIEAVKHLNGRYNNIIMVAGSDRAESFQKLLDQYNGVEYNYQNIKVVSSGDRDPDSDTAAGMSGTKMRSAAVENDLDTFQQGLPAGLDSKDAQALMVTIQQGLTKPARKTKAAVAKETMLPTSAFAGSDKNKLGPAAHLKGSMKRPARAGDLVGGESIDMKEDWQRVNRKDKTAGMSKKAVKAYRRENPGSKLQTAVTTKPSKLKKDSKSAKRRKSFCSRMKGMKKSRTSAKTARDPDSNINKALRRWNCESIEEMQDMIAYAENYITEAKKKTLKNTNPCWKGYKSVGTKKKDGRTVPNCVPISEGWEQEMSNAIDKLLENFADGKNPGRKGLAKRSGVDCKQSVSKLRSVAKSSSGEKQRMAHWCANMKSGKKK